jgi:hypothetical protein
MGMGHDRGFVGPGGVALVALIPGNWEAREETLSVMRLA